jgi:hypothetical protein
MTQVANGNSYSDAGETAKDMRDGGHRAWLLAMLSDVMVSINALITGAFTTNVRTVTGTGAQTVAQSDHIIVWNPTTPADVTFALPTSPTTGERHVFKYRLQTGQLFGLTIDAGTGKTFDQNGTQTITLREPLRDIAFVYRGANEWIADWTYSQAIGLVANSNILINPMMEIDQEHEGASVSLSTTTVTHILDGWDAQFINATAVVAAQRVTDAPDGFANSLKLTVSTGAAVAAGDLLRIVQKIEANEITKSAFGTSSAANMSLRFWVKTHGVGTNYVMSGALQNTGPNPTRSYPFNFTVAAADTWEEKRITIPGDIAGSWTLSGNGEGMRLDLVAAAGSTWQGTGNTWASANTFGTASNTSTILSTNGATFQVTGLKLEVGNVPTALERRSFDAELTRCQRHYRKSYNLGVAPAALTSAGCIVAPLWGTSNAAYIFNTRLVPSMRANPTVTVYSPITGTAAKLSLNSSSDISAATSEIGMNGFDVSGTFTPTVAGNIAFNFVADARL